MKPLCSKLLIVIFLFIITPIADAQIQVDRLTLKGFNAIGFGGFFNFSVPVSDANYITGELGLDAFSSNENNVLLAPVLMGYRYTIDGSGTGFYLEPNAGYSFGGTDIQSQDPNQNYADLKLSGPAAGLGFGYLFPVPSGAVPIQFNISIRYEHIFGSVSQDMFSFRISHAFSFGRRDSY
jgi:hypothetical protein